MQLNERLVRYMSRAATSAPMRRVVRCHRGRVASDINLNLSQNISFAGPFFAVRRFSLVPVLPMSYTRQL